MVIPLIKRGEKRYALRLSGKAKTKLMEFKERVEILIRNKPDNAPLFTAAQDLTKTLSDD